MVKLRVTGKLCELLQMVSDVSNIIVHSFSHKCERKDEKLKQHSQDKRTKGNRLMLSLGFINLTSVRNISVIYI